ncbi:MAG: hypothetical protein RIR62_252 [Pseudomonadota bacterium]
MLGLRELALAVGLSALAAVPASAGHLFTQGDTNTPVWLQQGQAVFVEQFYSSEYDNTPGEFRLYLDDGSESTDYYSDPAKIPAGADTTDPDWYKWNAGDVISVTIQTANGPMTWTAAHDPASGTCAYTFCGFGYDNAGSDSTDLLPDDIPTYGAYGTFMSDLDEAKTTSGGGLDLSEITALGNAGMQSLAPYFFGAAGTDDPAVAFANADTNADSIISEEEMAYFVWTYSSDIFDAVMAANNDTATGVLNGFGILFTAVQGDFALTGYRITDSAGLRLHGSGSGPVDQSSICTPPNCGPQGAVTEVGTVASVRQSTFVVDQALRQATQMLVGAAEQEVDVNFNEVGGPTVSTSGLSVSTSDSATQYRWAARAEGSFDQNSELGKTRNGSFVVAYGLRDDLDIGVYGSRRGVDLSFGGFGFDGNMTSVGVYLRQRPDDGLGLQWKLAVGGAVGSADISRAAGIEGAEAGAGTADLNGRVAAFELGRGSKVGDTLVTSFGRLTYSKMGREAYTETSDITAPVTYGAYEQTLTTITLGLNADRRLSERVRVTGGVYAVRDLSRSADSVTGSAVLGGLDEFTLAAPEVVNATRFGLDVTAFFDVGSDSRIYTRAGAQRAANTGKPTVSIALGYEARF